MSPRVRNSTISRRCIVGVNSGQFVLITGRPVYDVVDRKTSARAGNVWLEWRSNPPRLDFDARQLAADQQARLIQMVTEQCRDEIEGLEQALEKERDQRAVFTSALEKAHSGFTPPHQGNWYWRDLVELDFATWVRADEVGDGDYNWVARFQQLLKETENTIQDLNKSLKKYQEQAQDTYIWADVEVATVKTISVTPV